MASMAPLCPCVLTRSRCHFVPRLTSLGFPGRREWWVESGGDERRAEKEGGGSFPGRHLLLASCRSGTRFSGGRGALPRLLSPASRRVDSRSGGDGGAGSGRDGGSARCEKAGAARGAKKGTGGAGSPFPRWVASLPHIARIPGPARNGGARRPYPVPMSFCPPPHVARIPGPAGMVGGGAFLRQAPPVLAARACGARDAKRHEHRAWAAVCAGERTGCQGEKKRRCALASARGGGAGILPPRRSGSRFSAGRRGEERARCGPTRLNAIRPALFVRGDSLWIPAATYLPGPSPAKYCRRMRA